MNSSYLTLLNLNNVKFLQAKIDEINIDFSISAINLLIWKFYNTFPYFYIDQKTVFIFLVKYTTNQQMQIKKININILEPIVLDSNDLQVAWQKAFLILKEQTLFNQNLIETKIVVFDKNNLPNITHNTFSLESEFNYSYLYETNQLKYMLGKKMQKRRNFINVYKKNFEKDTKIIKYDKQFQNEIINFCKKFSVDKLTDKLRTYEIGALKVLFSDLNPFKGIGSLLYYQNKMIGFTYGYIINNRYEIFVEKADKNYKGVFQYLISENLKLNDINTNYIDRQDDMHNENLKKSKISYKPISTPLLYFYSLNKPTKF